MTRTKDAKKGREFFINPEIGDIRFQEPDRFKSTYIKVREVRPESPCENCKRLHRIIAKELSENDDLGAEFSYVLSLKEEITRLKSQLAMCKETLKSIVYDDACADYDAKQCLAKLDGVK